MSQLDALKASICARVGAEQPLNERELLALLKRVVSENAELLKGGANEIASIPKQKCDPGPPHFCRFSEVILENEAMSVWLLAWPLEHPGTEIHDHGNSRAAVYVVSGSVKETVYTRQGNPHLRNLPEGRFVSLPATWIHKFEDQHDTGRMALTLHFYSPPLARMDFYVEQDGSLTPTGQWRRDANKKAA
jgi:hypothetical protein